MSSTSSLAFAPASDPMTDSELRALVIDTLESDPQASFEQIFTRLRARTGRSIPSEESERLRTIYEAEGYASDATESRSGEAARVASLATFVHFRPNRKEIVGLAAGLIPLVIHVPSITLPRSNAVGATASYFDFIALAGGIAALVAGFGAGSLLAKTGQRPLHVGMTAAIVLLGLYQVLLGLGLLHRIGLYHFS